MNDEVAFLAAIRAVPTDRTTQLVYADWLDDHGLKSELAAVLRGPLGYSVATFAAAHDVPLDMAYIACDIVYPNTLCRVLSVAAWVVDPATACPLNDLMEWQADFNEGNSTRFDRTSTLCLPDLEVLWNAAQIRNAMRQYFGDYSQDNVRAHLDETFASFNLPRLFIANRDSRAGTPCGSA